jgi:hypothetical protein
MKRPWNWKLAKSISLFMNIKTGTAMAMCGFYGPCPILKCCTEAVETARRADAVILVLGLSQRLEGEEMPIEVDGFLGGDRTHLECCLSKPSANS